MEELSAKLLHSPRNTITGGSTWEFLVDSGVEAKMHGNLETALGLSKSWNKIPKGKSKGSTTGSNIGYKRVNALSQKETQRKYGSKKKTKEKAVHNPVACEVKICREAGNVCLYLRMNMLGHIEMLMFFFSLMLIH